MPSTKHTFRAWAYQAWTYIQAAFAGDAPEITEDQPGRCIASIHYMATCSAAVETMARCDSAVERMATCTAEVQAI